MPEWLHTIAVFALALVGIAMFATYLWFQSFTGIAY